MIRIFLWMMLGVLSACGGAPVARQPHAFEQVKAADKHARQALRSGELLTAQQNFLRTLALQQSLDDTAGAATTLINLATVAHQLHRDEAALNWLNKLLVDKPQIYSPQSMQLAAFRKAVILTDLARLREAEDALGLSEKFCEKKCALRFSIDVLRARLALLQDDAQHALELAQAVEKEAGAGREELANALRIIAASEAKLARDASALQHYKDALEIDKSLGRSRRIAEDLKGMSGVSARLGLVQEAATYARRAELVLESSRPSAIASDE